MNLFFVDPTKIKQKCAQYWPDNEEKTSIHNHMQVKILAETHLSDPDNVIVNDIIERDLEVCNQTAGKYC